MSTVMRFIYAEVRLPGSVWPTRRLSHIEVSRSDGSGTSMSPEQYAEHCRRVAAEQVVLDEARGDAEALEAHAEEMMRRAQKLRDEAKQRRAEAQKRMNEVRAGNI